MARSQSRSRRELKTLLVRKQFLIICEGQATEPNYFEGFKKMLPKDSLQIARPSVLAAAVCQ
jgi:hypothetical protein